MKRDSKGRFIFGTEPWNKGTRLKLKRGVLNNKKNKIRGNKRENKTENWLVSQGYNILIKKHTYFPYDFLVEKDGQKFLIEHKSCLKKIYSGKGKVVSGRFKIIIENHQKLFEEAQRKNAVPLYLFHVIGGGDIFIRTWKEIDKIIKKTSSSYFLPIKLILSDDYERKN